MAFLRIFLISLLFSGYLQAGDPLKVLFVGNSYTGQNRLPEVVRQLAENLPAPEILEISSHTPGGCTFERHANEGKVAERLKTFKPSMVVLQEQSQMPVLDPERTRLGARALNELITEAGAKPLFYMTWARAHKPEMMEGLANTYLGLGKELGAKVAPVGLAWKASLAAHPDWPLHKPDQSHPNQQGSYLAACVILATLTSQDLNELPDEGFSLQSVTAEQAAYFQNLAMKHEQLIEGAQK